jgi:RNA-directed DNA polymerase
VPQSMVDRGGSGKAMSRTPDIDAGEKSDACIRLRIDPNKGYKPAEGREERRAAERNTQGFPALRTQGRAGASMGLAGVREVARKSKEVRFTALMHHITSSLLRESFMHLKRDAAPGVDGVTWRSYEENLDAKIARLHEAVHLGHYRAQPSRRAYIPKSDGSQRPLGIAALEDKIVQQAAVMVLNAIYEEDFLGFSYGFRSGRSPHQALDALVVGMHRRQVNWVLDADIRSFYDTIDHEWMMRFLEHRIADPRMLRLMRKWLTAGVVEHGQKHTVRVGLPQGAPVSCLLANIYLHYTFDLWAHRWRRREATGDVIIVRFADDNVVGFAHRFEAERFLKDLKARLEKFGLALHPDKTRRIEFGRYAAERRAARGLAKPQTFNFLGFVHACARTRKNGYFTVIRLSMAKRLRAALREIKGTLRRRMHDPIPEVGAWLRRVVQGFFNYHAVPGNHRRLFAFRGEVCRAWLRTLRRRSQRKRLTWERFQRLVERYIPPVRILHPQPGDRFCVSTLGKSRMP